MWQGQNQRCFLLESRGFYFANTDAELSLDVLPAGVSSLRYTNLIGEDRLVYYCSWVFNIWLMWWSPGKNISQLGFEWHQKPTWLFSNTPDHRRVQPGKAVSMPLQWQAAISIHFSDSSSCILDELEQTRRNHSADLNLALPRSEQWWWPRGAGQLSEQLGYICILLCNRGLVSTLMCDTWLWSLVKPRWSSSRRTISCSFSSLFREWRQQVIHPNRPWRGSLLWKQRGGFSHRSLTLKYVNHVLFPVLVDMSSIMSSPCPVSSLVISVGK